MSYWLDETGTDLTSGDLSRREVLVRGGGAFAGAVLFGVGLGTMVPTARGAAYTRPGEVLIGVAGGTRPRDLLRFVTRVRQPIDVWQLFLTWDSSPNAAAFVRARLKGSAISHHRLMFHLTTANSGGHEVISPAALASGGGDAYLLMLNQELAAAGQITYVRPFGEMNQARNVYCGFNAGGAPRAGHSPAMFKQAFRRTALILRGGSVAAINARLRALRMPPVRTRAAALGVAKVALVWCPHSFSSPDIAANSPRAYYPGGAYVDWVGGDVYSEGSRSLRQRGLALTPLAGLSRLYSQFPGKPFAIGEWGIGRGGSTGFIESVFAWIQSHPRVKMELVFQGNGLDVLSHPGADVKLHDQIGKLRALRGGTKFQAVCTHSDHSGILSSGWYGPERDTAVEARGDVNAHLQAHPTHKGWCNVL